MSKMNLSEGVSPIKGFLDITVRDKATGDVIEEDKDNNIFLQLGMQEILQALTEANPGGGYLSNILQTLRIGDDVGTGTQLAPEPAQADYTAADQDEIYTVEYADFTRNYPNYYTAEITTIIDGDSVMSLYPSEVDKRFTSAALYTGDGTPIAYRRFQARTITRQVVIDVKWTLLFSGQGA